MSRKVRLVVRPRSASRARTCCLEHDVANSHQHHVKSPRVAPPVSKWRHLGKRSKVRDELKPKIHHDGWSRDEQTRGSNLHVKISYEFQE